MPNVSLLIKPASGLCNMRCKYCFYEDEVQSREEKTTGLMSREDAGILIEKAFAYAGPRGSILFNFQGGEPTLAGIDFFRFFTQEAARQNRHRIPLSYGIQTNGYSLDPGFPALFREYGFLVGVSIDGHQALHDRNRLDPAGKGTYSRVVETVNALVRAGVEVNLLCVVTGPCAKSPQRIYRAMKDLGLRHFQFIPCLDPLEAERGSMDYSLTPQGYGKFLCGLFDAWYADWRRGEYISVRLFEDYVYNLMGLPCGTCASAGVCGKYLVVESDLRVYPCDFYCLDSWLLGSLRESSVQQLLESPREKTFLGEVRGDACRECPWYPACRGGCKRDYHSPGGRAENYHCPAFRQLFAYAWPRLTEAARQEAAARRRMQ